MSTDGITPEQFEEYLGSVGDKLDFTDLLEGPIKDLVAQGIQSNFDRQQTSEGQAWPPRKDSLPHPLLNLSGALRGAATGSGPGAIVEVRDGTDLILGVAASASGEGGIPAAKVHQYGDVDRKIPARPYMGVSQQTLEEIKAITKVEVKAQVVASLKGGR